MGSGQGLSRRLKGTTTTLLANMTSRRKRMEITRRFLNIILDKIVNINSCLNMIIKFERRRRRAVEVITTITIMRGGSKPARRR